MRTIVSDCRGIRRCLVVVGVTFSIGLRICEADPKIDTRPFASGQFLDLVRVVLDEQASADRKRDAMSQIGQLPDQARNAAYENIVSRGQADHAYSAATALVMAGATSAVDAIWSAFPKWRPAEQAGILGRIPHAPNPREFLLLPRRLLQQLENQRVRVDPLELDSFGMSADIVGVSAQLLKGSQDPHDVALVSRSVHLAPRSMSAWYAVASQDAIPAEISDYALSVMDDAALPERVRIAAAVVAERKNEKAKEFISRILRAFVEEYQDETIADMIPKGQSSSPRYAAFQRDLIMFYSALVGPSDSVEKHVFDAIAGRNEPLRGVALSIAARRWPERVLAMTKNTGLGDVRIGAAARLVEYHPGMEVQAKSALGLIDFDKEVQKLRDTDPWLVSKGMEVFGLLNRSIAPD